MPPAPVNRHPVPCCWPLIFYALLLVSCSRCEQGDLRATETNIAANIFASLTASVPAQTATPIETYTPSPTDTPQASATPLPRAAVEAATLNVREGPDTNYAVLTMLKQKDEVAVIGEFNQCSWLKIRLNDGTIGWAKAGPGYLKLPGDCGLIPHGTFRPANGTIVFDQRKQRGMGQLTVDNGTASDGLVVLVNGTNKPLIGFYVRGKNQFTLSGIPDGNYQIFFTKGDEWDGEDRKFLKVESTKKMDSRLAFTTSATSYSTWTISLQPVAGGNTQTSDIPPGDFPTLK